jgi:arylformamidase
MKLYDVTLPLSSVMPTYNDKEPGPTLDYHGRMARGDVYNISSLHLGSHTGTHVDAPHHFIDGAATVDQMPLNALVGPVTVVQHDDDRHISAADLEVAALPPDTTRVLFKTRNARLLDDDRFRNDFVAITPEAARWLVDRGVVLVGIDYMSIEPYDTTDFAVHLTLLGSSVVIVEGLDLRAVDPGTYTMACAPLPVVGAEGAPARVFLWTEG